MKVVVALLAVLVSGAAFAAGDGHAPGPGSLIAPAINVAITLIPMLTNVRGIRTVGTMRG